MRWQEGRQGTGYQKRLLLQRAGPPLPFDLYLLRYPPGAQIPEHTDPVAKGRHFRLNIVLKRGRGGEFRCAAPIVNTPRIKLFRPDVQPHSIGLVHEARYVLSLGWLLP